MRFRDASGMNSFFISDCFERENQVKGYTFTEHWVSGRYLIIFCFKRGPPSSELKLAEITSDSNCSVFKVIQEVCSVIISYIRGPVF